MLILRVGLAPCLITSWNAGFPFNTAICSMDNQEHATYHLGRFPFVRTGGPNHCPTGQLENEIGFFQESLLKTISFAHAIHDLTDLRRSGRRVLIKREIIIATGMVWPVSSDKWDAPLVIIG